MKNIIVIYLILSSFSIQAACPTASITFITQSQIDSFSINYPGCAAMPYSISIQESVSGNITNLNGLNQLTSIGGDLNINYNILLASLGGLNAINLIGGNLDIKHNFSLINLTGLNALTSIGGNSYINDNILMTSLTGLNMLTSVGGTLILILTLVDKFSRIKYS